MTATQKVSNSLEVLDADTSVSFVITMRKIESEKAMAMKFVIKRTYLRIRIACIKTYVTFVHDRGARVCKLRHCKNFALFVILGRRRMSLRRDYIRKNRMLT